MKIKKLIFKNPYLILGLLLLILLALIIISHKIQNRNLSKENLQPKQEIVKKVQTYHIGNNPKISVTAKAEKSGVITIYTQTSGIVNTIYHREGEQITKGTWLAYLSSNYQGGSALAIQSQLAQKNYQFQKNNLDLQKDIINKNRDIANKQDENSQKMRDIYRDSKDLTQQTLDLAKQNIETIDQAITYYQSLTTSGDLSDYNSDEAVIMGLKQQKSLYINSVIAAESKLKDIDVDADQDLTKQISNLNKEIVNKQLDLQEKSLQLNLEISQLNYQLSQVNLSLAYPSAPFAGTIEKVHVKVGQMVNPGQPLFSIAGNKQSIKLVALVGKNIAQNITRYQPSTINLGSRQISEFPTYISTEPTNDNLYSIIYYLKNSQNNKNQKGYSQENNLLTEINQGDYLQINIPIQKSQTSAIFPFVPIDAIYQSQDQAYLFLLKDGISQVQTVKLGKLFGNYVEVIDGLKDQDEIILDRNIISGEKLESTN